MQATEIESLRSKVKQFGDYDEIKRELEIMKVNLCMVRVTDIQYVEFSGGDMDDDDVKLPDPNADVANKQLGQSLENLLVSKNRRLLEDLTKIRVSWEDLSTSHAKSEQAIESLQNELERVKELNDKLESDLMNVNEGGDRRERESTPAPGLAGLDIGKQVSRLILYGFGV